MAGPPMSMWPILWAVMASAWSAAPRTPSRPPWTTGCKVLTRPSIISGKPVRSATSFTGTPKPAMAARVPPVETSSTPRPCRVRAASSSPVLSLSEIRARFGATRSGAGGKSGAAGMATSVSGVGSGRRAASSTVRQRIEPVGSESERRNRPSLPGAWLDGRGGRRGVGFRRRLWIALDRVGFGFARHGAPCNRRVDHGHSGSVPAPAHGADRRPGIAFFPRAGIKHAGQNLVGIVPDERQGRNAFKLVFLGIAGAIVDHQRLALQDAVGALYEERLRRGSPSQSAVGQDGEGSAAQIEDPGLGRRGTIGIVDIAASHRRQGEYPGHSRRGARGGSVGGDGGRVWRGVRGGLVAR